MIALQLLGLTDPGTWRAPPIVRLFRKAEVCATSGCWVWRGAYDQTGYGMFKNGTFQRVHCAAYRLLRGPIPEGLEIDHVCRNRGCVNPAHLEAVTHAENMRRAGAHRRQLGIKRADSARCSKGHERTAESVRIAKNGIRFCRVCERGRYDRKNEYNRNMRRVGINAERFPESRNTN